MARPAGILPFAVGRRGFSTGSCPDEKLAGVLPATLRADPPPARRAIGPREEPRASFAHFSEEHKGRSKSNGEMRGRAMNGSLSPPGRGLG
ncbi:hypothetical protein SAMN04487997_3272 [Frateuria terrea]|uniref:Uncharacterized protein n=1 Tax=Frateuria terrea TaxID=529704 RepID=A0A1H6YK14_9GAMM|nr:hypothetical protein SAMN04487997_3272 [Frateuria terrea]SFP74135.1 hypothetical protein SAMN02927913_3411 [Frateuria terrea]